VRPIGTLRSCYGQKFGIPRQAGLVPAATAVLELDPAVVTRDALRGLEGFSHVWVIFRFHLAADVKMTVRPPRLGGARRVGVLATRSPHRPNHLGLSAVALARVDLDGLSLELRGGDFLDGTPVYDVKPYLPYADALPDATAAWADPPIPRSNVTFSPVAAAFCAVTPGMSEVVAQSLALDPRRPGARGGTYAMRIGPWDVRCRAEPDGSWFVDGFVRVDVEAATAEPDPDDEA
jgi:tRNA-Thr(GGU) m(6)t(6)A37 methyltransferase TsaA